MSNKDKALKFMRKERLLGVCTLDFVIAEGDRVVLLDVLDKENGGILEIPSFITDIFGSPLVGCKFSEVHINNQDYKEFNAFELCSGMLSKRLKLVFKNPMNVIGMSYMFYNCKLLEELDIRGIDMSNVKDIRGMFTGCDRLKNIKCSEQTIRCMEGKIKSGLRNIKINNNNNI